MLLLAGSLSLCRPQIPPSPPRPSQNPPSAGSISLRPVLQLLGLCLPWAHMPAPNPTLSPQVSLGQRRHPLVINQSSTVRPPWLPEP